jgi:hypothetical protein
MNGQRYRAQFDSHLALNEKPLLARPLFQPFRLSRQLESADLRPSLEFLRKDIATRKTL